MSLLDGRLAVKNALHHPRGEIDEMHILVARGVERVLQGPEGMIERAVGILVRPVGVGNRRELNEAIGLDLAKTARQRVIVPRVEHVHRDSGLSQKPHALEDEVDVEGLVGIRSGVGEGPEIIYLQPIDDMRIGTMLLERKRKIVANKARATD